MSNTQAGTKDKLNAARKDMPALTGLRFVAAAYIVLLHQWRVFLPSSAGSRYWDTLVTMGFIAVSFFFVLSGFILATVYFRNSRPLDQGLFWQARIARIYPVYALSLVLSAPFALVKRDSHGLSYHLLKAGFLTIANFSLVQAWHPALSGNWNRPCWSVSVEVFFYLIFPAAGAWVVRHQSKALWMVLGFWLCSISSSMVCLHFVPAMAASLPRLEIFLFDPLLRVPEFMIGVCCGVWASRRPVAASQHLMWAGLAACVLSLPLLGRLPWILAANGLLAPIFGAVIVGLSRTEGIGARLLGNRVMVHLGQASFSLYLLHFPVFFWMAFAMSKGSVVDRFIGGWPLHHDSPGYFALYLVLAVLVSLASYAFIETPLRGAVKVWLERREAAARHAAAAAASTPEADCLPASTLIPAHDVSA